VPGSAPALAHPSSCDRGPPAKRHVLSHGDLGHDHVEGVRAGVAAGSARKRSSCRSAKMPTKRAWAEGQDWIRLQAASAFVSAARPRGTYCTETAIGRQTRPKPST